MTSRAISETSAYSQAEGSRKNLAEDFFAHLDRFWQEHGREILVRLSTERPKVYFRAMVKLARVQHLQPGKLSDFDRRRNREAVLQRLEKLRGETPGSIQDRAI